MTRLYFDTETCGFYGMPVIIQYAVDDGPITIHEFWRVPVQESLELIESMLQHDVVAFNMVFDWFQLCKLYTTFLLCPPDWIPEEHIDEIAVLEKEARNGPCLKPKRALDLMLVAKRGPYQSLMDRKDIRIRKVPNALAHQLCEYLEKSIQLDDIYFSRRKDKYAPRWIVQESKGKPGFKDIVLKFKASGALKVLAEHALKISKSDILLHSDIELDKKFRPFEKGWAPFALACGKPGKWNWSWPEVIQHHIDHWAYNPLARRYAGDDVDYTRGLDKFFGYPEPGDVDSSLACSIAAVRWRGFKIDEDKTKQQMADIRKKCKEVPMSPRVAKIYITQVMSETEAMAVTGTSRRALEELSRMECDCTFDSEIKDCQICGGSGRHPAALRAEEVLVARQGKRRYDVLKKLMEAGRFHASYKVIGTLSGRMSGADKLNPQGFERLKAMRACFTLADPGQDLSGGDFDSFEVVIGAAVYDDPQLTADLTAPYPCDCHKKTGTTKPDCEDCWGTGTTTKKLHGLFGMELSGLSYEEVIATKGNPRRDWYNTGKAGILSKFYGGDYGTLVRKQGVDEEVAKHADEAFERKYPGVARDRRKIIDMFCSMRQPGGIGTKVEWHDPADKIESLLGFPRYFTLENAICKALFMLANDIPPEWKALKMRVMRTDRLQTPAGATASALYGAAFGIQSNAMRAAANHRIQSTGAEITKQLQKNIFDLQPVGVHPFVVVPMNAHDEVMVASRPDITADVKRIADATVESYRQMIPLIKMFWKVGMANWSEK